MNRKTLLKTLLLATSIGALTLSITPKAHAQAFNSNTFQWQGNAPFAFLTPGPGYNGGLWMNYNGSNNFSLSWSNTGGDVTAGVGWLTGWWGHTIGYNAGYCNIRGAGSFGIYGWLKHFQGQSDIDTEYYIIERYDPNGVNPTSGCDYFGSFTANGATYKVYHSIDWNSHGISGDATGSEKWISLRATPNSIGTNNTVDCGAHFNQWTALGWRHNGYWGYQVLAIDTWGPNNSGELNATVW